MTPDEIDALDAITQRAAIAAEKASHPILSDPDKGIHKEPIDRQCDELLKAGWKPVALHPRSPVWITPTGVKVPGPGYAHSLMLKGKHEQHKEIVRCEQSPSQQPESALTRHFIERSRYVQLTN